MAEAYVVGMVVPQEQPDEEDVMSDDIEALFGDSSDGDVVVPAITDEQVALLASFETVHCEESTRQFMAAERKALAAMLVTRANAASEAARMAEAAVELAAREEAARAGAHAATRAEELANTSQTYL
jgi:regulator of protease activity HflC (stomatin/prohibitin superfamily)